MLGGWGFKADVGFLRILFMLDCHFDDELLKIHIFKVLFWRGGSVIKKTTLCTLVKMTPYHSLIILKTI